MITKMKGIEDTDVASCLRQVGSSMKSSLDQEGRERLFADKILQF